MVRNRLHMTLASFDDRSFSKIDFTASDSYPPSHLPFPQIHASQKNVF